MKTQQFLLSMTFSMITYGGIMALTFQPTKTHATINQHQHVQGITRPANAVDLSPMQQGHIANITVDEGSLVKTNDLLLALEASAEQASLKVIENQIADTSRIAQAEAKLQSIEARLDIAQAQFHASQDELNALEKLLIENSTSEREVNNARHAVTEAQANVQSAEADIRVAQAELDNITAEHARLSLQAESQRLELQRYMIRAPFSGMITRIDASVGEATNPNEPVLRLVQLDTLEAEFHLSRRIAANLAVGGTLTLYATEPNGTKVPLEATVEFISPELDTATETQRILLSIDNHDLRWPAGMLLTLEH